VFSWEDGDNNGAVITHYFATLWADAVQDEIVAQKEHRDTTDRQILFEQVEAERQYWVTVAAVNEAGTGAPSQPLEITATDFAEVQS